MPPTVKNFERFIKELDTATIPIQEQSRKCLQSIHLLTTINPPDQDPALGISRLVATDACLLIICDVETGVLDWACHDNVRLLIRREKDGAVCYLHPKKKYPSKRTIYSHIRI